VQAGYFSPLLYQFTGDNNNLSDLYIESVQVENKIFGSPYVGSRPASWFITLIHNWSCGRRLVNMLLEETGWYTPMVLMVSIESLGANSNTVGGGYI
jgi:hypothetical protein